MRLLVALALLSTPFALGEMLSPVWVELGAGGRAIARAIVSSADECPSVEIAGAWRHMLPRQPVPAGFRPVCEFAIPPEAKAAHVNGRPLPLPRANPSRIVVLGDTGCRIQGARLQDCNDPAQWPFQRVAASAAGARPDLVIHVGDYLYREDPCPADKQAECGGAPSGDNFGAWNADFFKRAAALLAAAPWLVTRGNHENCQRSWRGWFYYLDPGPWTGRCIDASPPYLVEMGKFQAIDFDSSAANENQATPEQFNLYSTQLAGLSANHAWLVDHHPFWGVRADGANAAPVPQTIVLQQAWDKAGPRGIDVVLSGHTHLFELLSYGQARPLQIVAGDGGTNLADPVPDQVNGMDIHGVMVTASENKRAFGYTLFTRHGSNWRMRLQDLEARTLVKCEIAGREAKCEGQVVKVDSRK